MKTEAIAWMIAAVSVATSVYSVLRHREADIKFEVLRADFRLGLEALTKRFEEASRSLGEETPPADNTLLFDCVGDWCTADSTKHFLFPKGIVIGYKTEGCSYGDGILSVDGYGYDTGEGQNCPQGNGSVTLGQRNTATGRSAVVTGGKMNTAEYDSSWVGGGQLNVASGSASAVSGGYGNKAEGWVASISGGESNTATGESSSIAGGYRGTATNYYSTINGGYYNEATGEASSVTGGSYNKATGDYSSIQGGNKNLASGETSSVSGGNRIVVDKKYSTGAPFNRTSDGWWIADKNSHFLFSRGLVVGKKNMACNYGNATLTVDAGKKEEGTNCPSGQGSVTFGISNKVTGSFSTILGGMKNKVSKKGGAILGGKKKNISEDFKTIPKL
eukprot:CAMPEP_0113313310 /NCGR_PEP_ID=MMETSP0010_2-20120614/9787_1 /TAXON_ID=216773 ORGANISM="Corethron hystrix, Strain 308" /NCGR_SAMPLE_ID=MMETSP0010_2 /ASSEMBLY_ACC=CAM_ASM_000155 /LENGTH=388 /DNA_ID=CAMNT_0000169301 /DNA_START=140 /DNA_END=1309 /DNA_ORIENTATION=+ /assembly_acc=CAM_ASM_000155